MAIIFFAAHFMYENSFLWVLPFRLFYTNFKSFAMKTVTKKIFTVIIPTVI